MYKYCELEGLKYVIGLIRNDVLERIIEALLEKVHTQYLATGQKQRMFAEAVYQAVRVIMKAKWLLQGPNSRFVVSNLSDDPKDLYEYYTERGGTCEVRLDEFKNGLKADRLSFCRQSVQTFSAYGRILAFAETPGSFK